MSIIDNSLFYQEFADHYAQIAELADQDAYHVTSVAALGRPRPHIIQMCGEIAIATMLRQQLLAHGWTIVECPIPFGGKLYNNFKDDRMLDQVVVDSKFSIVIESNYTYHGQSYFTEKTFRALMLPRPFFVAFGYSSPNRIKYLRDCGFNVHDDIIDHSYDNINDPIRQQIAILDQMQKLQDLEYTPTLLEELERRAQHNRNLVDQMFDQLEQRYRQVVDKIQSIS
jgi:hypothetical protein